ncbi:hypothetical protein AcW1_000051 [Taiwanofungus camphoratus]|nr:hypothetical protein AcW1_000051 [Antrodia cinnamomea]
MLFIFRSLLTVMSSNLGRIKMRYPKCFVVVRCWSNSYRTTISSRAKVIEWNQTFCFVAQVAQVQDIVEISLYRKTKKTEYLIGQVIENLLHLPRNEVLTRVCSNPHKSSNHTISFRIGDTAISDPHSRIYAVIIGINIYKSPRVPNLNGCLNDAKAMKLFLSDHLHVPDSHIVFLSNETATRAAILSTIQTHLIENPNVKQDDPIIVFYAGHGSRVDAPPGWASADGKIETICPYDEWAQDIQGHYISGIPDRTINELFRKLASEKGNNITLIFDSCHSGGITRKDRSRDELYARLLTDPCPITRHLDEAIWDDDSSRSAHLVIPPGFRHRAMSTHVLLAACEENQVAYETRSPEHEPCGLFSYALINQLRQTTLHSTTYSHLIDSLPPLSHQRPQCEGLGKDYILFKGMAADTQAASSKRLFRMKTVDGKFEVEAGEIHGVACGTEFLIQDPDKYKYLGILVAEAVRVNSSILVHRKDDTGFTVPAQAKAQVLDWKSSQSILKVFVDPRSNYSPLISPWAETGATNADNWKPPQYFVLVDSPSKAHLALSVTDDGQVQIERLGGFISTPANRAVTFEPKEEMPSILNAISHFEYHLDRRLNDDLFVQSPEHFGTVVSGTVHIRLYRLKRAEAGFLEPDKDAGDCFRNNAAKIRNEKGAKYGIEITNHSDLDLFPYLFYFDPSDYSIQDWYLPPARMMAPPLKRMQAVTVGYGAGGGDPIEFELNQHDESDTGFLKLFVSTFYVDMDHIAQPSVFEGLWTRKATRKAEEFSMCGSWVMTITVTAI